jgi:hypothetical protein
LGNRQGSAPDSGKVLFLGKALLIEAEVNLYTEAHSDGFAEADTELMVT